MGERMKRLIALLLGLAMTCLAPGCAGRGVPRSWQSSLPASSRGTAPDLSASGETGAAPTVCSGLNLSCQVTKDLGKKLREAFPECFEHAYRLWVCSVNGDHVLLTINRSKDRPDRVPGFSMHTLRLVDYDWRRDKLTSVRTFSGAVHLSSVVWFENAYYYVVFDDDPATGGRFPYALWKLHSGDREEKLASGTTTPGYHTDLNVINGALVYFLPDIKDETENQTFRVELWRRKAGRATRLITYVAGGQMDNKREMVKTLGLFMGYALDQIAYLTTEKERSFLNVYDEKSARIVKQALTGVAERLLSAGPYVVVYEDQNKRYALYDGRTQRLKEYDKAFSNPEMSLFARPGGGGEALMRENDGTLYWIRLAADPDDSTRGRIPYQVFDPKRDDDRLECLHFVDAGTLLIFTMSDKQDLFMQVVSVS